MQSIFPKENADKALKYRLYRHLPAYEKIIRNLVSFSNKNSFDLIDDESFIMIRINNSNIVFLIDDSTIEYGFITRSTNDH